MIQAIIFDMDGLLVDSEPRWHEARAGLFSDHDLEWIEANSRQTMGVSTEEWANYMVSLSQGRLSPPQVVDGVLARLEAGYRQEVPLTPGAQETIDALHGRYRLAVASGSHPRLLRAVLDGTNWETKLEHVVSSDEVARGKPASDIYLETARRLGVSPAGCAVFEDSVAGIQAGVAAGMKVIAVPNSHLRPPDETLAQADLVLESLLDFQPAMLEQFSR